MTTVTFDQKIRLPQTNFSNIEEFIDAVITMQPWELQEEAFNHEEKMILDNRSDSTKKNEQEIFSLLSD